MEKLNYDIERWKSIGILDNIPKERYVGAMSALNATLNFINENSFTTNKNFETTPIMVIIKILREVNISTEQAIEIVKEFKNIKIPITDDDFFSTLNIVDEIVSTYVEHKLNELK